MKYAYLLWFSCIMFYPNTTWAQDDIYYDPDISYDDEYVDGNQENNNSIWSDDFEDEYRRINRFCTTFNVTLVISNPAWYYRDAWWSYDPYVHYLGRRYLRWNNRRYSRWNNWHWGYHNHWRHYRHCGPRWAGYYHHGYYGGYRPHAHYTPWGWVYHRKGQDIQNGRGSGRSIAKANTLPPKSEAISVGGRKESNTLQSNAGKSEGRQATRSLANGNSSKAPSRSQKTDRPKTETRAPKSANSNTGRNTRSETRTSKPRPNYGSKPKQPSRSPSRSSRSERPRSSYSGKSKSPTRSNKKPNTQKPRSYSPSKKRSSSKRQSPRPSSSRKPSASRSSRGKSSSSRRRG